ncbi:sugar-binding protein [Glycomyces buryatensis]|uniref:Sugar ABC transporter substrate-binding protein n=1 Tax=Glycomyces buryatensis TaxID=2570927 RepID=A0A4S8Q7Y6_9ACTN|nr:sugar-binding protein [Glycomyces buryatensis]THV39471.1 sugar ABC transporter substrate-binding protein [Glycomyces buryatensis]
MHLSRRGLLSGSAGVAAVSLAGCSAGEDSVQLSGFTGIAMPATDSDRWVIEGEVMEQLLKDKGYQTVLEYAENNADDQIAQIQSMVDQGAEFLIIGAVDNTSLGQVLLQAKNQGVYIIAYDRLILETPDVDYYASFDNNQVGVLQAEHIIKKLDLENQDGPFNIELFSGSLTDSNSEYFFQGGLDTLERYIYEDKIRILSGQTEQDVTATKDWNGVVAMDRMTELLETYYEDDPLHAVLSPYDGISRGIVAALKEGGYNPGADDFPIVTGQDAEARSVRAIKEGNGQTQTVFKDTRDLADIAVSMVEAIVAGRTPEVNDLGTYENGFKHVPAYLLEPVNVDASNYVEILIDSEYLTAEEIDNAEEDLEF